MFRSIGIWHRWRVHSYEIPGRVEDSRGKIQNDWNRKIVTQESPQRASQKVERLNGPSSVYSSQLDT